MASAGAAQKLQLLADALALDFSQSLASAQACGTLRRLLPSLEYLSISVSNPAQGGSIVASANCATEGPTTLHLHDPLNSAAGISLAAGRPLQTSLLNAATDKVVPSWSDVQQMVLQCPNITHLLCLPFGSDDGSGSGNGDSIIEAPAPQCQRHGACGSGRGALLFGFSSEPVLDSRHRATLALLAHCLPVPMAQLSVDTLAFVNFACGSAQRCSCCCGASDGEDSEEETAEGSQPGSPCGGGDHGRGGDSGAAPSQALRVPANGGDAVDGALSSSEGAGASRRAEPFGGAISGSKAAAAAAAAPSSAAAAGPAATSPAPSREPALGTPQGRPRTSTRFSKALVAAAAADGSALQQRPVALAFRSPLAEAEFGNWILQYHIKVDALFSVLLVAALLIVIFVRPYRLIENAPGSLVLGTGMVLPLVFCWLRRETYARWREFVIIIMRIYVVAFINLVSIRSYQGHLPEGRTKQWITFWMLTGAESLSVTSVGFPLRMQLHIPLQLAAMGLAAWNIPRMCAECYPAMESNACYTSSAAMAAIFGYILPTAAIWYIEQRSRSVFAGLLRSVAVHES